MCHLLECLQGLALYLAHYRCLKIFVDLNRWLEKNGAFLVHSLLFMSFHKCSPQSQRNTDKWGNIWKKGNYDRRFGTRCNRMDKGRYFACKIKPLQRDENLHRILHRLRGRGWGWVGGVRRGTCFREEDQDQLVKITEKHILSSLNCLRKVEKTEYVEV